MSVVVLINGREAIPVRAIPLVAPVPYGVRYLVEGLMCCDRLNAMHGLTAYQWPPGEKQPLAVPPTQWMQVDSRLRALKASLERQVSTELLSRDEGDGRYNREPISILPAGVFVWKGDLVDARTRKLRRFTEDEIVALQDSSRDYIRFLQQQLELLENDPGVDQWEYQLGENWREQMAACIAEERAIDPIPPESIVLYERICCGQAPLTDVIFSPLVEPDLYKQVMEGFEHLLTVEASPVPAEQPALSDNDQPGTKKPDDWIIRAREIADDIWLRDLNVCKKPVKEKIAPEIARRLWSEKIVTKRNIRISTGYIERFALRNGWTPPRPD